MRHVRMGCLAWVGLIVLTLPAGADLLIRQHVHTDPFTLMGEEHAARDDTVTIWLAGERASLQGGDQHVILRGDQSFLYVVDDEQERYFRIELPVDLERYLPTEGREAQRAQQMLQMLKASLHVARGDSTHQFGDWPAHLYQVEISSPAATITRASWIAKDLGHDLEPYFRLQEMLFAVNPATRNIADQVRRLPGIPVYEEQSIAVMGSTITSQTTAIEIAEAKAPAAAFRLPRGFARETYDPLEAFRR